MNAQLLPPAPPVPALAPAQASNGAAPCSPDLSPQQIELFRKQEWATIENLLRAANHVLETLRKTEPQKLTLSDAAKALEMASKLGRAASGLDREAPDPTAAPLRPEFEEQLRNIYGEDHE